ncbi:YbhB/YbcL family Raf kinase inhibitor-like protein [Rhizobium rhizogenes]|uniref:YbhB/YbcL family Raf kinase inhibitor-like protein n=1 Tax=Rhizobium rhizogenes TaxID=359 RepID=UPI0004D4D11A|nr:YbhB/YbcL family Raf kinase inhibitor-like protein [Rhizobium rhizogenes]KEA07636.1 phosphatidylethanolamine-binding protein [Rhizobium rhizogenes]MQB28948.1 YbhB/YbcL family Raf kinase inhibitor-like protein [Rhizobium rhizogenes]NTF67284.1 YbhB/YbcL family Raf kinase inhibitor-like protein [Rhizobium rhizogenes]NTI79973.1 YbhB/YbcL family Raf kinase inhibitor-like protein [Rhizobium rhizogenes]NTJ22074.1 YbhB/YbcL family Raf kinase inhibitor-like protein [Rhizobium rhizogenes]
MRHTPHLLGAIAIAAAVTTGSPAFAADLKVKFEKSDGRMLLPENASCIATPNSKSAPGPNKSVALSWSKGPKGTRSYALTMVDPDVPSDFSLFNKDDTIIPRNFKRMEFVHWVLADIPASLTSLPEGADGDNSPAAGLPLERTDHGRRGQNGAGGGSLKNGPHGGYMGACPPWNDERIHGYHVTVYALDVDRLNLPDLFTRADLLAAAKRHILASGNQELLYTLNAKARK